MEIGQKLKDKRTALGLSQEQLAEQMGVTRQTIANWEKGKTYPDIASVLKLSDLYGVSLDELLKEDASMRKHMEESAALPKRYWNLLFELAILLNPFGLLVAYWGAYWLGLGMQIVGLLMMPPLWVARHRMFGMSQEDLKNSIIGWSLFVCSTVLRFLSGENLYLSIIANIVYIVAILMIWSHGIYLERGTRFWLVIALWFGIPIFVWASGYLEQFSEMGAFSKAQPFGEYRIVQAEFGEAEDPSLIVTVDPYLSGLKLDIGDARIGEFQYVEPTKYQEETVKGTWHLVPEENTDALYKLEVSAEDKTTLSYFEDDQLQWRWELKQLPKAHFELETSQFTSASEFDWFAGGYWDGDPDAMNYTKLAETATGAIRFHEDSVTELTVTAEYHHGNQVSIQEYLLFQDEKDGMFHLPGEISKRYEDEEQYILYRFQWDTGEYLFRLIFK